MNYDKIKVLYQATRNNEIHIVKKLLMDPEVDVNYVFPKENSHFGWRVLAIAVLNGSQEVIQAYFECERLDVDQSINNVKFLQKQEEEFFQFGNNVNQESILEFIIKEGSIETLKLFHKFHPNQFKKNELLCNIRKVFLRNDKEMLDAFVELSENDFHTFAADNIEEILKLALDCENFSAFLHLSFGKRFAYLFANINPSEFLVNHYNGKLTKVSVNWLCRNGILDGRMIDGSTMFMKLVSEGKWRKAQRLFNSGYDLSILDFKGRNSYMYAKSFSKFLDLFSITENDFLNVIKCNSFERKADAINEVLKLFPHFKSVLELHLDRLILHEPVLVLELKHFLTIDRKNIEKLMVSTATNVSDTECFMELFKSLRLKFCSEFHDMLRCNRLKIINLALKRGITLDLFNFLQNELEIDLGTIIDDKTVLMKLFETEVDESFGEYLETTDSAAFVAENQFGKFFHQDEFLISENNTNLLFRLHSKGKINLHEPSRKSGTTVIFRLIQNLSENQDYIFTSHLKEIGYKLTLEEYFDLAQKISSVEYILQLFPSTSAFLKLRHKGQSIFHACINPRFSFSQWDDELLSTTFLYLKSGDSNETPFELLLRMGSEKNIFESFTSCVFSANIDTVRKVMNSLEFWKPGFITSYPNRLFSAALTSDNLSIIKWVVEELGVPASTIVVDQMSALFPIDAFTYNSHYRPVNNNIVLYLIEKGANTVFDVHQGSKIFSLANSSCIEESTIDLILSHGYDFTFEIDFIKSKLINWARSIYMNPDFGTFDDTFVYFLTHQNVVSLLDEFDFSAALVPCDKGKDISTFLRLGANPFNDISFGFCYSALFYGAVHWNEDCWRVLKTVGNVEIEDLFEVNEDCGMTPIDIIFNSENQEIKAGFLRVFPELLEIKPVDCIKYSLEFLSKNLLGDQNNCGLCFEKYFEDDDIAILDCKHSFHYICLKNLGKNVAKCPFCRKRFLISHLSLSVAF